MGFRKNIWCIRHEQVKIVWVFATGFKGNDETVKGQVGPGRYDEWHTRVWNFYYYVQ